MPSVSDQSKRRYQHDARKLLLSDRTRTYGERNEPLDAVSLSKVETLFQLH